MNTAFLSSVLHQITTIAYMQPKLNTQVNAKYYFSFQKWWMLTKVLRSVFSRVVRVTGPLRAMSWNVTVPLRLCFQLRVPKSPGQSILATWLNSSLFLPDNALNCFCWFTVLKAHQSYGSWLNINHYWRAPLGYVLNTDTHLLLCFMKKVSVTFLHWHL